MWNTLQIPEELVVVCTDKSIKIDMPGGGKYRGYNCWISRKIVHINVRYIGEEKFYVYEIVYKDNFTFMLKKYGNGRYNKYEVIDEKEISAEVFCEEINENAPPPLIHTPIKLFPVKTEVIPELIDNE